MRQPPHPAAPRRDSLTRWYQDILHTAIDAATTSRTNAVYRTSFAPRAAAMDDNTPAKIMNIRPPTGLMTITPISTRMTETTSKTLADLFLMSLSYNNVYSEQAGRLEQRSYGKPTYHIVSLSAIIRHGRLAKRNPRPRSRRLDSLAG